VPLRRDDLTVGMDRERIVAGDPHASAPVHLDVGEARVGAAHHGGEEKGDPPPGKSVGDADVEEPVIDTRLRTEPESAAMAASVPHGHEGEVPVGHHLPVDLHSHVGIGMVAEDLEEGPPVHRQAAEPGGLRRLDPDSRVESHAHPVHEVAVVHSPHIHPPDRCLHERADRAPEVTVGHAGRLGEIVSASEGEQTERRSGPIS